MTKFDYFIILADMRTGSNFLESNLNAVDGLSCLGEAFNPGFIGYPMQEALFGISLDQREADPQNVAGCDQGGGWSVRFSVLSQP
jgi:hypothetical protein